MPKEIRIAKITGVRHHGAARGDNSVSIDWIDTEGGKGTTTGSYRSLHMQALLARAVRELKKISVDIDK